MIVAFAKKISSERDDAGRKARPQLPAEETTCSLHTTSTSYLSRKNLPVDDGSCEKTGHVAAGWRCLTLVVDVLKGTALDWILLAKLSHPGCSFGEFLIIENLHSVRNPVTDQSTHDLADPCRRESL